MKKYKETVHSIAEWSIATFPALNAEMQVKKLKEELEEEARAKNSDRWLGEMADCYIVSAILWDRFYSPLGRMGLEWVEAHPEYDKIREAVDEKMIINKARKWHINKNGVYHH